MDDVVGLLVLVGLAVLAMPVLLIVALVSVSGLKRRVATLEAQVAQLRAARVAEPAPAPASTVSAPAAPVEDEGPTLADLMRDAAPAAASRRADKTVRSSRSTSRKRTLIAPRGFGRRAGRPSSCSIRSTLCPVASAKIWFRRSRIWRTCSA